MNQETLIESLTTVTECCELEIQAKSKGNLALANAARERRYRISINNLTTEKECENFIVNATRNQRQDLLPDIRRKSIALAVNNHPGSSKLSNVEKDCLKVLYGYEKALTHRNGRKTRATYTWRPIKKYGIVAGVDHIVSQNKVTDGFNHLSEIGLSDFSFEAVVLNYPNSFSNLAVERAKARMGHNF